MSSPERGSVGDLVQAMVGFGWAVSTFGMDQAARLITTRESRGQVDPTETLNSASQLMSDRCGSLMRGTFVAGDRLQRDVLRRLFGPLGCKCKDR